MFDPETVERKTVPWFRGDDEGINAVSAEDYDQLLQRYHEELAIRQVLTLSLQRVVTAAITEKYACLL